MCDLLGMSFNTAVNATISLDVFQLRGTANPDGWGVAFYRDHSLQIVKEVGPAVGSSLFDFVESYPYSKIFLSHVRRSTCGIKSYANTHPFYRQVRIGSSIKEWVFAHNGTLHKMDSLKLESFKPIGGTDSEHAFCYIIDTIVKRNITDWTTGDYRFLESLLQEINNHVNTFNCIFSDGDYVFCYSDENRFNGGLRFVRRAHPFGVVDLVRHDEKLGMIDIRNVDLDKHKTPDQAGYIIVTRELTDEDWLDFETGELIVFKDGEIVFSHNRARK